VSAPSDEQPRSISLEIEVAGTPDEVWEAIATGPGISSWMHPTEMDADAGSFSFDMGSGVKQEGRIAACEPPRRLVQEAHWAPPGSERATLASEWIVEARSGDMCVVRLVVSGFGSGGSWDDELEGFEESMTQSLRNLRLYLRDFRGRHASFVSTFGQASGSLGQAFEAFTGALGLAAVSEGANLVAADHGALALSGEIEELHLGAWRRDALLRIADPAPGFATVSVYGQARWTSIQAYLFGEDSAEIAAREQPRWEAWMHEHFPAQERPAR
jgi:uncharacterized protein YndB with AHSA1/START domain